MLIGVFCKQEVVSVIQMTVEVGYVVAVGCPVAGISEDKPITCSWTVLYLVEEDGMDLL
jgi:hypothetical protein